MWSRAVGGVALVSLIGCGRIGFDGPGERDAAAIDDAALGDSAAPDGAQAACKNDPRYRAAAGLTSTYRLSAIDRSWADAKADCELDGARLAIIDDAVEASSALIGDWVDLTDSAREGEWVTSRGDLAPFLVWAAGEPDGGTAENCGRLDDSVNAFQDRGCEDTRDYSCECE